MRTIFCLFAILFQTQLFAADYQQKTVGLLNSLGDGRSCTLFSLIGVSTADANLSTTGWFEVSSTNPNYKSQLATLMTAKAIGKSVHVITGPLGPCAGVTVGQLILE